MNRVILIGFRCCGKTTIGERLAKRLNWKFLDLDVEIQRKEGKTIKEMVKEKGWNYFRTIEKRELQALLCLKNIVVALGGGAVIHEEEMKRLKEGSFVVWLYAEPEVILKRLMEDKKTESQRPALTQKTPEEEITEILKQRTPLYQRFSHIKFDTGKHSPEEIVEKILKEVVSYED